MEKSKNWRRSSCRSLSSLVPPANPGLDCACQTAGETLLHATCPDVATLTDFSVPADSRLTCTRSIDVASCLPYAPSRFCSLVLHVLYSSNEGKPRQTTVRVSASSTNTASLTGGTLFSICTLLVKRKSARAGMSSATFAQKQKSDKKTLYAAARGKSLRLSDNR